MQKILTDNVKYKDVLIDFLKYICAVIQDVSFVMQKRHDYITYNYNIITITYL